MANVRRKRTTEEQALYDQIQNAKRLRVEQAAEIDRAVDLLFEVPAEEATDAVLGVRARFALSARRRFDETTQRLARLEERYEALRPL